MIYGDQKKKEIARSVLASKRRKGARMDLETIKRKNRRMIRQELKNAHVGLESHRDFDAVLPIHLPVEYAEINEHLACSVGADRHDGVDWFDENFYPYREIRHVVRDRRDNENLGALLRWAPHQVEGIRLLDRLSHLRGMLPDTLQGRHAVGHVGYLDEFHVENHQYGFYRRTPEERKRLRDEWKFTQACEYAALMKALERIVGSGNFHMFNRQRWFVEEVTEVNEAEYTKGRQRTEPAVGLRYNGSTRYKAEDGAYFKYQTCKRPLLGVDDIEAWIKDMTRERSLTWEKVDKFDPRKKG